MIISTQGLLLVGHSLPSPFSVSSKYHRAFVMQVKTNPLEDEIEKIFISVTCSNLINFIKIKKNLMYYLSRAEIPPQPPLKIHL